MKIAVARAGYMGLYNAVLLAEHHEAVTLDIVPEKVPPGAIPSVRKHYQRAEHWIIVKGTAEVTCEEKVLTLTDNQSTYVHLSEFHCLTNPGQAPREIIKDQSGSYLSEDEIVRFGNKYGRWNYLEQTLRAKRILSLAPVGCAA